MLGIDWWNGIVWKAYVKVDASTISSEKNLLSEHREAEMLRNRLESWSVK